MEPNEHTLCPCRYVPWPMWTTIATTMAIINAHTTLRECSATLHDTLRHVLPFCKHRASKHETTAHTLNSHFYLDPGPAATPTRQVLTRLPSIPFGTCSLARRPSNSVSRKLSTVWKGPWAPLFASLKSSSLLAPSFSQVRMRLRMPVQHQPPSF